MRKEKHFTGKGEVKESLRDTWARPNICNQLIQTDTDYAKYIGKIGIGNIGKIPIMDTIYSL
jgi:hypothetical protein